METQQTEDRRAPDERNVTPKFLNSTPTFDFNAFVQKIVLWVGTICAAVALLGYIIVVTVMVVGFEGNANWGSDVVFAIVNALVGVLIMYFMKVQGSSFAKAEPETKKWLNKYYTRRTKTRKYRSMKFFWVKSTALDIIIKGVIIGFTTVGVIYVFIEASNDAMKIMMALFNILMFIGFGFVSLVKAYNFMKEEHVEFIKHELEIAEADAATAKIEALSKMKYEFERDKIDYFVHKWQPIIEDYILAKTVDKAVDYALQYKEYIIATPPTEETVNTEPVEIKEENHG